MNAVILYASVHHGNTEKVVQTMAEQLPARLVNLAREQAPDLEEYDLVGVASGIYYGKVHSAVKAFLDGAVIPAGKRAFGVCTCGAKSGKYAQMLEKLLTEKGFDCLGSFQCQGYDTYGPFKLVGGIAKGHPSDEELEQARRFAKGLAEGET